MPETKEWTLMFYMASDNPLAISIVSQLKALKDAGFHHKANVIAQFDPFTEGTPTHIFDVNLINKLKQPFSSNIGFDDTDPFVRNLIEDKLWRDEKGEEGEFVRDVLQKVMKQKHKIAYNPPKAPKLNGNSRSNNGNRHYEPDPLTSLQTFLNFCAQRYPARHYMLFILGHGVVVGNDVFLYDEHAEKHSITLNEMGEALSEFKDKIQEQDATFELVGFHSCSVSSMEVAYELKNTANYMMASQGPTFVGSWPYRQILIRVFNELETKGDQPNIPKLVSDIFSYCVSNSADYLLAGYSYQLTLCDLRQVHKLKGPIEKLSTAFVNALSSDDETQRNDAASTFIILYAHWKAQSFFQEMYTDLNDFCSCILERCQRIREVSREKLTPRLEAVESACKEVTIVLEKAKGENSEQMIVKAEVAGPAYQYSCGLSVFFPWSQPSEDSQILQQYAGYKIHTDFHPELNSMFGLETNQTPSNSWLDFLKLYFRETQRVTKSTELQWELDAKKKGKVLSEPKTTIDQIEQKLGEDIGALIYNGEGPLAGFSLNKTDPTDRTGIGDCDCPSIKNYPRDTRTRRIRQKRAQSVPFPATPL